MQIPRDRILYSAKTLAEATSLSEPYIKREIYVGNIPSVKIGKARRVTHGGVVSWLASRGVSIDEVAE